VVKNKNTNNNSTGLAAWILLQSCATVDADKKLRSEEMLIARVNGQSMFISHS